MFKIFHVFIVLLLAPSIAVYAQDARTDSLVSVIKKLPDDTSRVNHLLDLCSVYSETNILKMIEVAHEALACAKRNNYEKGIADAYGWLGTAYSDVENNRMALVYYLEALSMDEKRNDLEAMGAGYNDIGNLYVKERKFDKGLEYYRKAMAIWQQVGNKRGQTTALYNLANIYQEQGNDATALEYYNRAVENAERINHTYVLTASMINMGLINLKRHDCKVALQFADKAFQLASDNHHKSFLPEIHGLYSDIYVSQGMPQKAIIEAEKGLEMAGMVNKKLYILQNYKRVADAYFAAGDLPKAYQFLSTYAQLDDSLRSMANKESIEQVLHGYELDKKDMELEAKAQQYQSDLFKRNAFIILLIGLLLIIYLIYRQTKLVLASRQQQLKYVTQTLLEKSAMITAIQSELDVLKRSETTVDRNMEKFSRILQLKIRTEEEWENFKKAFEEVYPRFFHNLRYKYPGITASELRLAAITKLNLSVKEAATMLGISSESVKQSRYRLKKRIGVPEDTTLKEVLENYG
ncbi:MAG TPA: tetratricopeptide repeat protein [Ohtaekwangia sp.]|uniref:tetratricopeptide repeat protein n=1 Tax=Ohtaekwangia sp. TaxID=2066019 RepID=UPI002F95DBE2